MKKKTDEPTPDDPHNSSDESEETEEEQLDEGDEEPPKLENEVCYILEFRMDNIPIQDDAEEKKNEESEVGDGDN